MFLEIVLKLKEKEAIYKDGWNLSSASNNGLPERMRRAIREKRFIFSLHSFIFNHLRHFAIRIVHPLFSFRINNIKYRYFTHKYNAIDGERCVEIPWVLTQIDVNKKILEVGNVLSHYVNFSHTVVDRYERAPEVINEDAEVFQPTTKYDFIISISTLEHIGFDETVKDDLKISRVISNLKSLINDGGKILITVPLVYNPTIDKIVINNDEGFSKMIFLKQISRFNRWKQCTLDEALKLKYGSKYPAANSVAFLVFDKQGV
ncbi:MAG: hypothetical protein AMDU1_APLC00066G0002 [Thermoplasmatales archaeon A-plasma]|jgi:hypothetical protein|nr:MAG: hypothetical protein AMDU1_APLC00066G0002 [Thermoplasmatales archaeon A-plasma]